MFALSQIEHDLPMPPHLLSRPLPDAIKAELERLFLDKVTRILALFSRGISIVAKILLVVPAIIGLNPFRSQHWWFLNVCICLRFAYDVGNRKPWAVRVCL
jgi:hypothetical protein